MALQRRGDAEKTLIIGNCACGAATIKNAVHSASLR